MAFAKRFQDFCFVLSYKENFGPIMLSDSGIISTNESYIKNITLKV